MLAGWFETSYAISLSISLLALFVMALLGWLYSVWVDEVSIVEPLWPIMVLSAAILYLVLLGANEILSNALLLMISLWSLRMCYFLVIRGRYRPEQRKFRTMRRKLSTSFHRKSLYLVFIPYAFSAWIASFLFCLIIHFSVMGQLQWSILQNIAVFIWMLGFLIQVIADYQLHKYNRQVVHVSGTYGRGLWRYSRHPNYFGECCIWWAWFLMAMPSVHFFAIVSPLYVTYLVVKVKASDSVEQEIASRRPDYKDYIKSTSFMVPWKPKF